MIDVGCNRQLQTMFGRDIPVKFSPVTSDNIFTKDDLPPIDSTYN